MLIVSHGLGVDFTTPPPKFEVGDFPDEPVVASDLSTVTQQQAAFTQALAQNVAANLKSAEQQIAQLQRRVRALTIASAVTGVASLVLGVAIFRKR